MEFSKHNENKDAALLASIPPSETSFKWKDVPKENWFFLDYKDEFLRSRYTLDGPTLVARWAGIHTAPEILAFMEWPDLIDARWQTQNSDSDPASDEFRLRRNNIWLRRWDSIAQGAARKLESGTDTIINGDGKKEEVPLSPRARAALVTQVHTAWKAERTIQGETTEIIEKRGGETKVTLQQLILQGVSGLSPRSQAALTERLSIEDMEITIPAVENQGAEKL